MVLKKLSARITRTATMAARDLPVSRAWGTRWVALIQIYQPRIKELLERTGQSRELLSLAPNDPNYSLEAAKMSQLAGATASEMVILLSELQSNAFALLSNEQQARYMELRAEQRERMEQCRAEMEARRESGETGHSCAACEWLKADDAAQQDTAEELRQLLVCIRTAFIEGPAIEVVDTQFVAQNFVSWKILKHRF